MRLRWNRLKLLSVFFFSFTVGLLNKDIKISSSIALLLQLATALTQKCYVIWYKYSTTTEPTDVNTKKPGIVILLRHHLFTIIIENYTKLEFAIWARPLITLLSNGEGIAISNEVWHARAGKGCLKTVVFQNKALSVEFIVKNISFVFTKYKVHTWREGMGGERLIFDQVW